MVSIRRLVPLVVVAALVAACEPRDEREGVSCDGENVLDGEDRFIETCRTPEVCGSVGDGQAACVLPAAEGEACESEASLAPCIDGLVCTDIGGEIAICVDPTPRLQGERCFVSSLIVPCAEGLGCSLSGTCELVCTSSAECEPDQGCALPPAASEVEGEPGACEAVCTRTRRLDESCVAFLEDDFCVQRASCSAGLVCVNGEYADTATCKQPCVNDSECASGAFCSETSCGGFCEAVHEEGDRCEPLEFLVGDTVCQRSERCAEGLVCEPGVIGDVCVQE